MQYKDNSFFKCSPIWSPGCYSKGDIQQEPFTTEEKCAQVCAQKILNGELFVGAAKDPSYCFCEVSTSGVTLINGIQTHIEFNGTH